MSVQFINCLVQALDQSSSSSDTQVITKAHKDIQQAQSHDECVPSLLNIIMKPNDLKSMQSVSGGALKCDEVYLAALVLLKNIINQHWELTEGSQGDLSNDKENMSLNSNFQGQTQTQLNFVISEQNKEMIKANIFQALDMASTKKISSQIEHIIFNLAQTDFGCKKWGDCYQQIEQRLACNDENVQLVGLRALKEVVRASQYDIDREKQARIELGAKFLPILLSIMQTAIQTQGPNSLQFMVVICKIFYMLNASRIQPYLVTQGQLQPWIDVLTGIMGASQGDQNLITKTNDTQNIEQLEKQDWWILKGLCAKIAIKLYIKFADDSNYVNMSRGQEKMNKDVLDQRQTAAFVKDFKTNHLQRLSQACLEQVLLTQEQFVGTRTLSLSIKFLAMSLSTKETRNVIKPHIHTFLFGISLPLFLTNQKELDSFENDPVEYVRLQVDNQNEFNVKKQLSVLVERLCALKNGSKKIKGASMHLQEYLQQIAVNLQSVQGQEGPTEALLYAFGNLKERCLWNEQPEMKNLVQGILQTFTYPCLEMPKENVQESIQRIHLRARACWVYGRFGTFDFPDDQAHQQAAVELLVQHLYHSHIAVRVEAALALSGMLDHEVVQNLLRPGLGRILKVFLKIMDDIDFEDLVGALRKIVVVYQDEIAPFAVSLCQKLSEAYVRCMNQKGSNPEDIDSEISLTADGLITAIRRVLQSISGKLPQLYPQLEAILEETIFMSLSEQGQENADEGLTCISELIYNQNVVSERMWKIYFHIINLYVKDSGVVDDKIAQASVPLINFMVKAPEVFKQQNFGGLGTPLEVMLSFIAKIFNDGEALGDEIHSMSAITLIMALLEHLGQGMSQVIHQINAFYIQEMTHAESKNYKNMLVQGIMMNLWYDQQTTIQSLNQHGMFDQTLKYIFENVETMDKDFEVKRLVLGLSSLICSTTQLEPQVQQQTPKFVNAIMYLCQKSFEIYEKKVNKNKEDEAEEDKDGEKGVIYDNDEDGECDIHLDEGDECESDDDWDVDESDDEFDNEMYDSKMDKIDEVLFFRDQLNNLQQVNGQQYQNIINSLDQNGQTTLQQFFSEAERLKFQQDEYEAQEELLKQQQNQAIDGQQRDITQCD